MNVDADLGIEELEDFSTPGFFSDLNTFLKGLFSMASNFMDMSSSFMG